jgi:hypothetical protein
MGSWSSTQADRVDGGAIVDALVEPGVDSAPSGYPAVVMADNPLAYYRLGDPPGTTVARDFSGNGHDGVISGQVTSGAAGAIKNDADTAMEFNGGSISLGNVFTFAGNAPFTIEAWAKPSTVDAIYRRLASKERSTAPRDGYSLWLVQQSAGATLGFERVITGTSTSAVGPLPTTTGFVHVVGTYDGSAQALYVNGTRTDRFVAAPALNDEPGSFLWGGTDNVTAPFVGVLDEVAVYGTALSEGRIYAHLIAGNGP